MSLPASTASPRTSPVTVFFSPAVRVPSRSLWVEGDFLRLALSATVIWKDVTGVTSTPPPLSSPPSLIGVRAPGSRMIGSGGSGPGVAVATERGSVRRPVGRSPSSSPPQAAAPRSASALAAAGGEDRKGKGQCEQRQRKGAYGHGRRAHSTAAAAQGQARGAQGSTSIRGG